MPILIASSDVRPSERDDGDRAKSFESGERESRGRGRLRISISFSDRVRVYTYISSLRSRTPKGLTTVRGSLARARDRGRFLSRGEDHSVHRRHLIANLSHLALPHKLNDRLNGWPSRYAKERFFGHFAKYPVKDFDGPLRSSLPRRERPRRSGFEGTVSFDYNAHINEIIAHVINLPLYNLTVIGESGRMKGEEALKNPNHAQTHGPLCRRIQSTTVVSQKSSRYRLGVAEEFDFLVGLHDSD